MRVLPACRQTTLLPSVLGRPKRMKESSSRGVDWCGGAPPHGRNAHRRRCRAFAWEHGAGRGEGDGGAEGDATRAAGSPSHVHCRCWHQGGQGVKYVHTHMEVVATGQLGGSPAAGAPPRPVRARNSWQRAARGRQAWRAAAARGQAMPAIARRPSPGGGARGVALAYHRPLQMLGSLRPVARRARGWRAGSHPAATGQARAPALAESRIRAQHEMGRGP